MGGTSSYQNPVDRSDHSGSRGPDHEVLFERDLKYNNTSQTNISIIAVSTAIPEQLQDQGMIGAEIVSGGLCFFWLWRSKVNYSSIQRTCEFELIKI